MQIIHKNHKILPVISLWSHRAVSIVAYAHRNSKRNVFDEWVFPDKPLIVVFNKTDAYTFTPKEEDDLTPRTKENVSLDELMHTWMARMNENCIFISAREKDNIDALKDLLYRRVRELHVQKYPYNDFLYQTYDEGEYDTNS